MPLNHMQHFLVQSEDVEKTKDWYVNVLGLKEGYTPDFKFPVYWLYIEDQDVLHLTQGGKDVSQNRMTYLGQQSQDTRGSGVIDHIAFHASDLHGMIRHFEERNIRFTERQVDSQGLYQLFLSDPNGIKIELNFPNAEAKGRRPQVMASELVDEEQGASSGGHGH
jgi:catechol 2,3-dioxygenase-like lactoylglutathione lyase family enzyme